MKFESMRSGHARCPPYLVAGPLLISILLACNWWSLSSQNYELLKQMDDMGDQLNICADERVNCMSRRNTAETQLREAETKAKITLSKHESDVKKLRNDATDYKTIGDKAKEDLNLCKIEMESLNKLDQSKTATLASLRLEKEAIMGYLNEAKDKVKDLEAQIKSLKVVSGENKVVKSSAPNLQKYTSSTAPQNKIKPPEAVDDGAINDGPVNDANHEIDTALDNAAIEDMDDRGGMPDADVIKKPPLNNLS